MHNVAISADGVPIHYDVRGNGVPALIFIHGWCCDRSYWQKQMDYFAPLHTVVAIDLAGHGDSGLNRETWSMEAFGQDVAAVVEGLDLRQVILIGHSLGGTVMIAAALQLPGRVIALIGADTL